jgi:hypothetical protein
VAAIPKSSPPIKPKKTTPKKTKKKKKATVPATTKKSEKTSNSSTSHSKETSTKESKSDEDQWGHEPPARMKKTPMKAFVHQEVTSGKGIQRSLSQ